MNRDSATKIQQPTTEELERRPGLIYRNIANFVSLLGVAPLPLLFMTNGYEFVVPMMIYNNIMDDLDGVVAGKLRIRSAFGATLDNVCDVAAHSVFVMVIAMQHGVIAGAVSVAAVLAIVVRSVSRLQPNPVSGGSPTNELVRHMIFVLLLAEIYVFDATAFLIAAFVFNAVTMLAPLPMPYLLRSMGKTTLAIVAVNLALLGAWLIPAVAPVIAACFFISYAISFVAMLRGGVGSSSRSRPV